MGKQETNGKENTFRQFKTPDNMVLAFPRGYIQKDMRSYILADERPSIRFSKGMEG